MLAPAVLAEIGDKTPGFVGTLALNALLAAAGLGVARIRPWLFVLVLPIVTLQLCGLVSELRESHFGAQIQNELGAAWVWEQAAAVVMPMVLALRLVQHRRSAPRQLPVTAGLAPDSL